MKDYKAPAWAWVALDMADVIMTSDDNEINATDDLGHATLNVRNIFSF